MVKIAPRPYCRLGSLELDQLRREPPDLPDGALDRRLHLGVVFPEEVVPAYTDPEIADRVPESPAVIGHVDPAAARILRVVPRQHVHEQGGVRHRLGQRAGMIQ